MSFMIYDKDDNPVFPTNNSEASINFMLGLINSCGPHEAPQDRQSIQARQDSDSDEMTEDFDLHKKAI